MVVSRLYTDTLTLANLDSLRRLGTRLGFLQHLLTHTLAVVEAWLHHELLSCANGPAVTLGLYVGPGQEKALCCPDACEPGKRLELDQHWSVWKRNEELSCPECLLTECMQAELLPLLYNLRSMR